MLGQFDKIAAASEDVQNFAGRKFEELGDGRARRRRPEMHPARFNFPLDMFDCVKVSDR